MTKENGREINNFLVHPDGKIYVRDLVISDFNITPAAVEINKALVAICSQYHYWAVMQEKWVAIAEGIWTAQQAIDATRKMVKVGENYMVPDSVTRYIDLHYGTLIYFEMDLEALNIIRQAGLIRKYRPRLGALGQFHRFTLPAKYDRINCRFYLNVLGINDEKAKVVLEERW